MKKINCKTLMVSLMLLISLGLCSCASNSSGLENNESKDKKAAEVKKIGIVQIVEHPSLNSIRETIIKQLDKGGFKDGVNVSIDYQNAQGDQTNLKTICQKFSVNNYDLIIAIATPSAQAAAGETKSIPVLFSACTDPIASGVVTDLEKPGGNVTGTSDRISTTEVIKMMEKITPGVKSIGVIYSVNETSANIAAGELEAYAAKNNYELTQVTVTNTSEVSQAMQSLVGKVDVIFAPPDNTIASAMPLVSEIAIKGKVPLYVGADSMVADGGLATCGVNYVLLGEKTGNMAIEILKGKNPGDMPVETMENAEIYVNKSTADKIGITLPEDLLKSAAHVFGE